jgi:hypothetical protein
MRPKVAAIVSAYYASQFIKGRIENLLEQDLTPMIVVVAQKGSPEAKIVGDNWAGHPNINLVTTDDIPTVYDAWNIGIRFSDSDYLTNANSDDRLYPGALSMLAKTLDKNPEYAVAYPDVDRVEKIGGDPVGQFVWKEGGLTDLLTGCFVGPMPMWRRDLHSKHGMFDPEYKSAGDYEFWLRIASKNEKFMHVHRVLGAHLERPEALEHRSPLRTTWETARARAAYKPKDK